MKRDQITDDLFDVPQPAAPISATMNYSAELSHVVSDMLTAAGMNRYLVAAEMSRLTGKEVSKAMLDGYTSEARETFNLPFYLVPALETACRSHQLTAWLADKRGARVLVGREALNGELGKLESEKLRIAERIKHLKCVIGAEA